MAEAVLFYVAEGILKTLTSPLEIKLLWTVKDELRKFNDTVSAIKAVLLDAEEKSAVSNQVQLWLGLLKEAMYDAEDLLDDFSIETLRQKATPGRKVSKEVRLFLSSSNQLVYNIRISHRIREMRVRLDEIAAQRKFFLLERPFERPVMRILPTHSYPPHVVVGREAEKEAILKHLMSGKYDGNVATVAVVGIGGLGKTTLAQLVFNDKWVRSQFKLRLWVYVGENFDLKRIVKNIIEHANDTAGNELLEDMEMNAMVDILHAKIKAKLFLLVLDDVWNEDPHKWIMLKSQLNVGARGSRILVTTRHAKTAEITDPVEVYKLQGLSMNDAWLLFEQIVLREGEVPSEIQRQIGEAIIAKCAGNPLAIKVIGGLLYFKPISEWSSIRDKELLSMYQGEDGILSIIKLSYDKLPSYLKSCFAYCSLFPKAHKIHVPRLINLWIAQGYVEPSNPSKCPEANGLECFMYLLQGSFFEDTVEDELGNIISCRMHALMHDLAAQVAGRNMFLSTGNSVKQGSRHAAFYVDPTTPWEVPLSLFEARNLRTFLLMNETRIHLGVRETGCQLEKQQLHLIASKLGRLRALDLHSSSINKVPSSICKLKFLIYLDLSENKLIEVLPDSITRLLMLQTLKLDNCDKLKQLPKDTQALVSLIHLGVENCCALSHMPRGIGQLTSLSTLSRFVLPIDSSISKYGARLHELQDLNDLRGTLKIYNLPHAKGAESEFEAANLKAKKNLCMFRLEWSDGDEDHNDYDANDIGDDKMAMEALEPHLNLKKLELRGYMGLEFPSWLSSLTNLVAIALESCEKCQYLPPLHQLSHVKFLSLEGLTALKYVLDGEIKGGVSENFFPSLEKLVLSDCPGLEGWWKVAQTTSPKLKFAHLSHLSIVACPKLSSISMPAFPPLSSVKFSDSRMILLKEMLVPAETSSSATSSSSSLYSSSSLALSQLEALDIEAINDLESFPEDLFRNLKSLKNFRVSNCRRLKSLFQTIRHLSSLATLSIETCQELDLCDGSAGDGGLQWQGLESLHSLSIDRIPKLVSLPDWIQHLTFLQRLEISGCRNLKSLPSWLTNLRALQLLIITNCPQLTDRCQENGEDWQKIRDIPNVIVARKTVQGKLIQ